MPEETPQALVVAPAQAEQKLAAVAAGSPRRKAGFRPRAVVDVARLMPNEAAGYLMLQSDHWENLKRQCSEMVKGGGLPSSIDSPAKAAAIALKGIEMGIPLSSAWSGMRIIDGEITVLGKLALRLIYQRAVPAGATCKRIPVPEAERKLKAGWLMGRPGDEPEAFFYTMEDAKQAGLLRMFSKRTKDWIDTPAYKKYPERMLPWRALAYGASYIFADILQGCLITEELGHKDPEFIESQIVEAELSFNAPPREEVSKDDPAVRALSEQIKKHASLVIERNPVSGESDDDKAERFGKLRKKLWDDLLARFVPRGSDPTAAEIQKMTREVTVDMDRLRREGTPSA